MNLRDALAHPAIHWSSKPHLAAIKAEVCRTLIAEAPRKPFGADTARSMCLMNDVGALVTGDVDAEADMPWLTPEALRALWNQAARLLPRK